MRKFLVLMAIFMLSANLFATEQKGTDVLVSVNNSKITKTYVNNLLQKEAMLLPESQRTQDNLQKLTNAIISKRIDEIVVLDAAKKAKTSVTAKDVQNAINTTKKQYKNDADFNAALKKQGLTKAKYESEVKDNLMRVKYVSNEMKKRAAVPTEEEVQAFYNISVAKVNGEKVQLNNKQADEITDAAANRFKRIYGQQAKVRQIFIKYSDKYTKEEKKAVDEKIKNLKKELSAKHVNFAQLSEKYSDDDLLKQTKGDIGYVMKEDLTPEVSKVIFGLKIGAFNKSPIKTGNGYHFFRLEEMKADMPIEFEEVKPYLADALYKQSIQNEYEKLLAELRSKATIKVNEEL